MQQVGAVVEDAAPHQSLQLIDPRQLPVTISRVGRNVMVLAGHAWVLRRRSILMSVAAVVVVIIGAVALQFREAIASAGVAATRMVQGEFAAVGFGINRIEISGQVLSRDQDIVALMTFASSNSTLTFDAQKAQARLHWLRAVESATVRKVYPNRIIVEIVEKVPVVRWRVGRDTWLVDAHGTRIGTATGTEYAELPLVVGDGAADDALVMVRALDRHDVLKKDLAAVSRIGDRRWDLIYYTGLRVRLPEQGVAQALDRLDGYQRDYALLDRDVTLIDLRVPGVVSLKPTVRDDEAETP